MYKVYDQVVHQESRDLFLLVSIYRIAIHRARTIRFSLAYAHESLDSRSSFFCFSTKSPTLKLQHFFEFIFWSFPFYVPYEVEKRDYEYFSEMISSSNSGYQVRIARIP